MDDFGDWQFNCAFLRLHETHAADFSKQKVPKFYLSVHLKQYIFSFHFYSLSIFTLLCVCVCVGFGLLICIFIFFLFSKILQLEISKPIRLLKEDWTSTTKPLSVSVSFLCKHASKCTQLIKLKLELALCLCVFGTSRF